MPLQPAVLHRIILWCSISPQFSMNFRKNYKIKGANKFGNTSWRNSHIRSQVFHFEMHRFLKRKKGNILYWILSGFPMLSLKILIIFAEYSMMYHGRLCRKDVPLSLPIIHRKLRVNYSDEEFSVTSPYRKRAIRCVPNSIQSIYWWIINFT